MKKTLWDKGESLEQEVHRFTVGSDPIIDQQLAEYDVCASAAHAKMLAKIGILNDAELNKLLPCLDAIKKRAIEGKFEISFEQEDCHTAIEAELTEKLGELGKKIHAGRSRNDQVMVAVRLYLKAKCDSLIALSLDLCRAFYAQYEKHLTLPMPGYTHFQRAMPSSVGMWSLSFAEAFLALSKEGMDVRKWIDCNPLGVGSGFGTTLGLDRKLTTELLGFSRVQRNPAAVQNSRGAYELKLLRLCSDLASVVEKFAFDGVLFATSEFGFISLPNDFTTGSSIMPQKRNPDVLELLRGESARVRGAEDELRWAIAKLPSNYHRDFQLTKEPLIKGVGHTERMLSITSRVVDAIRFDEKRLRATMTDDLYVTYEVFRQVKSGASFRDAYQTVGEKYRSGKLERADLAADFAVIEAELKEEAAEFVKELAGVKRESEDAKQAFTNSLAGCLRLTT